MVERGSRSVFECTFYLIEYRLKVKLLVVIEVHPGKLHVLTTRQPHADAHVVPKQTQPTRPSCEIGSKCTDGREAVSQGCGNGVAVGAHQAVPVISLHKGAACW